MTYEVIILGHLHMPLYFIGTFTEYPYLSLGGCRKLKNELRTTAFFICVSSLRAGRQDEFQFSAIHDLFVSDPGAVEFFLIQIYFLYIDVPVRLFVGCDDEFFLRSCREGYFVEQRSAQLVFSLDRIDRVKAHGREDIPGGHLPAIFIPAKAIRGIVI